MSEQRLADVEGLVHPELAGVEIVEESGGDISRSDVLLKGVLAAGAVYGTRWSPRSSAAPSRWRSTSDHRHPQLRADARVPRVDVLRRSDEESEGIGRTEDAMPLLAGREAARRSAQRNDRKTRREAGREAEVQLRIQRHVGVPGARRNVREHRGQRLQRRRRRNQVERSTRRGRLDRPGRGPPRGGDRPAERARTGPGGVRPGARAKRQVAEGSRTLHRIGSPGQSRSAQGAAAFWAERATRSPIARHSVTEPVAAPPRPGPASRRGSAR